MKTKSLHRSAFFNPRVLISFAFCTIGVLLALLAFAFYPGGNALAAPKQQQNQAAVPALAQESANQADASARGDKPTGPASGPAPSAVDAAFTFDNTGSLNTPRGGHTTTLLP